MANSLTMHNSKAPSQVDKHPAYKTVSKDTKTLQDAVRRNHDGKWMTVREKNASKK